MQITVGVMFKCYVIGCWKTMYFIFMFPFQHCGAANIRRNEIVSTSLVFGIIF